MLSKVFPVDDVDLEQVHELSVVHWGLHFCTLVSALLNHRQVCLRKV